MLMMGSKQVVVNGNNAALDSSPRMVKGTTTASLRFCGIRALGCEVNWDSNEKMYGLQQNNTSRTMRITAWSF